ncbi:hypothetical protein H5410_017057 [Solanum commersonii]|uniref:Uncharacterized protein n=1 Tax=Solanum commersonii TaxID=4109 RepID=A0A9J5ZY83_SOLCO|nr:hypothetical protein H5410_017057 [Solanum commersonii]
MLLGILSCSDPPKVFAFWEDSTLKGPTNIGFLFAERLYKLNRFSTRLQKAKPINNTILRYFREKLVKKCLATNQINYRHALKEQTLKEPPYINIQENASNQITTSTCSSNKAKQLFPPFYAFEKGSTSNTCKAQQNVIPQVIYISGSTSNACSEQQNLTPKVATKKG